MLMRYIAFNMTLSGGENTALALEAGCICKDPIYVSGSYQTASRKLVPYPCLCTNAAPGLPGPLLVCLHFLEETEVRRSF